MSMSRHRREEILRVDHAGEYGAVAIYKGQLAVFERQHGKERIVGQLKEMAAQEQEHLDAFDRMLGAGSVRPTAMSPVWNAAGFALGVSQHQAWRGAPLADGTRLAPLNPVLVLKGRKP